MHTLETTTDTPRRCKRGVSIEKSHCVVIERQARKSNTKYQCKYCNFEFTGGPQKIRAHLSGRSENGTRVAKCQSAPEDVRDLMLSRRTTRQTADVSSTTNPSEISPRNPEEEHVVVLARSRSRQAKASNSRYQCRYCSLRFVGGPQKIRVHLTGEIEGSTRAAKCFLAPANVVQAMLLRSRAKSPAAPIITTTTETFESHPTSSHALLRSDDSSTTGSLHSIRP
ncbi:hypothetical protein EON63_02935 [archaeon]|nr:MAG: hypothetical protein EON63_02935 [archaeon]